MKKYSLLLLALLLLTTVGCTSKKIDGDVVTVTYALWVGLTMSIGSLVATVVGFFLKKHHYAGWFFLIFGPVSLLIFCPGFFTDRLTVTPEKLELRTGIWSMTKTVDIPWDKVKLISQEKKVTTGRRGRKDVNFDLEFNVENQGVISIRVNDLVLEAQDDIFKIIESRGIKYYDRSY